MKRHKLKLHFSRTYLNKMNNFYQFYDEIILETRKLELM